MVLYEYTCDNCGSFDIRLPLGESKIDNPINCPKCGAISYRKLTPFAIEMKGLVGKSIKTEPDRELEKRFTNG